MVVIVVVVVVVIVEVERGKRKVEMVVEEEDEMMMMMMMKVGRNECLDLDEEWQEDDLEWEFVLSWVWLVMQQELTKLVLFTLALIH